MSGFLSTEDLPEDYRDLKTTVATSRGRSSHPLPPSMIATTRSRTTVVKAMADMGLFGLPFPEEYGGMGGDYFASASRWRSSAR